MTTLTRRPRTIGAILNIADGHMRAAEAKWSRLTEGDISSIREKHDLIVKVEERCSLPHTSSRSRKWNSGAQGTCRR